jgi:hypothetical protein
MNKPAITKKVAAVVGAATLSVAMLGVLGGTQLTSQLGIGPLAACSPAGVCCIPKSEPILRGYTGTLSYPICPSSASPAKPTSIPASQVEAFVRRMVASYHVDATMSRTIYFDIMTTDFPTLANTRY